MAQNQVLNDIEERIYPMVTGAVSHIKGLFGWGLDNSAPVAAPSPTGTPVRPSNGVPGSTTSTSGTTPSGIIDPLQQTRLQSATGVRTASPARPVGGAGRGVGGTSLDNGACTASPTNHVTPSRTGSVNNDLAGRTKKKLGDTRGACSVDIASKSDANHNASASPFRQPLSSSSTDFEPLSACAEEPVLDLEEPDYSTSSEKLGRIQFSVSYDFEAQTLTIKIIKAEELAAKDLSGTSDPYVKISLLPDKKHTLTTNIKRKNLNPRWNEVFAFEGFPYNKVVAKTLYLLVLDYDRFSRDDPIGEVCLPLADLDLAAGPTMWKTLQPCKGSVGKLGVLLLSLCYQPDGYITMVIIKARDLKAKDINGLSDPYVKIWLMHDGKKIEKKKTVVKEKNLNPVFNETFVFAVPYERIRATSLVVSVMDYDRMGRNEAIGQIVLGTKSGVMEMKHWNEMFAKSRQPVTQWHILKDFG